MEIENTKIRHFTQLRVWQQGHKLTLGIYRITEKYPRHELFGLVSQIRRACVSVTSNIAEGFGRPGEREKIRFYSIAHGSLLEVQNQLILSKDLGFVKNEEFQTIWSETEILQKQLHALIGVIRRSRSI